MTNKIHVYRAEFKLTQEQLANLIGITRQTVIALEKNKYNPSLELAFRIANVFNCSIEDIFTYSIGLPNFKGAK